MEDKKFALLIDADNTAPKYIKTIMDELANIGVATYRRIYGDWTAENMSSWKSVLLDHSISPVQQYSYTSGKNSTDSAMIIDAMDILYADGVDGFCLVSSDSDFTRLAMRLREAGKTVVGMGKEQTPAPFVAACNQFKYLDVLYEEAQPKASKPAVKKQTKSDSKTKRTKEEIKRDKLIAAIKKIIEENSEDDGWMYAAKVGDILQKKNPDFDCRNYGYKKFVLLLQGLGFETQRRGAKSDSSAYDVYVRIKESK